MEKCIHCDVDVIYDGTDEAGHINYICPKCGEPPFD